MREYTWARVPNAPSVPVPNGQFEGLWTVLADGPGVVPWCVPTMYRARYVNGDQRSDWSDYTETCQSIKYSRPGFRVAEVAGFDVEWEISSPGLFPFWVIGKHTFVDEQNPCTKPNPQLAAPVQVVARRDPRDPRGPLDLRAAPVQAAKAQLALQTLLCLPVQ